MRTTRASAEIAPARPSSTVVLVRDADPTPEIFMVRRHERSSFGSAYAFPGGVLEEADSGVHDRCIGVMGADADRRLDLDGGGLDYFSAAIRELLEESGVLLAEHHLSPADVELARDQLNEGTLDWDAFVHDNDLGLRCDQLHYFTFWITPDALPKRYSTRFFLAELPAGQSASHCGGELTDSCWRSARQVLEAHASGKIRVHYPTRKTLESLASFDSASSLITWAKSCGENGVECHHPSVVPESER